MVGTKLKTAVKDDMGFGEIETFCVTEQELSLYDELEEFILSSPFAHFRQTVFWMQCNRDREPYFFILSRKKTKIVAAALVRQRKIPLIGKSKYFIDRGPVVLDIEYLSAHLEGIKKLLKKTALWIRINPYIWRGVRDEVSLLLEENKFRKINASVYSETIVLDLSQSERELWQGLRRALKTQINKATRLGIKAEPVKTESDLRVFVENYNVFARNKLIPQISTGIVEPLYKKLFSDAMHGNVWLAKCKGKIVSGIAVICTSDRAIYEWGFSNLSSEDRLLPASHRLHWQAILWAKQQGIRFYDFGGYNSTAGSSCGLNHFKLGFSKQKQQMMPEYRLVFHPWLTKILGIKVI